MKINIAVGILGFLIMVVEQRPLLPGDLQVSEDDRSSVAPGISREAGIIKGAETATVFMQNESAASSNSLFDQVPLKLRIGDTVVATDSSGHEQKGKVLDLSSKSLSLAIHGARRELDAGDIRALDLQSRDSLKNGALIGFGIGMGVTTVGVIATAASRHHSGDIAAVAVLGTLIYGGIGTALGMLVDSLVEERLPVYRAAATKPAATKISFSPLISRDKKGIALTLRFAR